VSDGASYGNLAEEDLSSGPRTSIMVWNVRSALNHGVADVEQIGELN
jgi:hypothetical protein